MYKGTVDPTFYSLFTALHNSGSPLTLQTIAQRSGYAEKTVQDFFAKFCGNNPDGSVDVNAPGSAFVKSEFVEKPAGKSICFSLTEKGKKFAEDLMRATDGSLARIVETTPIW